MKKVIVLSISVLAMVAAAEPLTLTWAGGASGYISDEESWSGGVEGHLAPQNGDTLVFSSAGSFTNDISGLALAALSFTSSGEVKLGGDETITVKCGGSVRSTGAGAVAISSPLRMGENPAVEPQAEGEVADLPEPVIVAAAGSGRKISISGIISGEAPIAVGAASGTVEFRGANTFTGKLSVTNGYFTAAGTKSLGAGEEEIFFKTGNGSGRAKVSLEGVTVNKPVVINGNAVTGEFGVKTTAQSVFNGSVTIETPTSFQLDGWTTAIFNGVFDCKSTIQGEVNTGSTLKIAGIGSKIAAFNLGFTSAASTDPKWYAKYVVSAPVRISGTDFKHYSMHIRKARGQFVMEVANAFTNTCTLAKDRDVPLRYTSGATDTTFNMNGYEQTFMSIQDEAGHTSNVITSDKACVLRLKQNWVANTVIDSAGTLREPGKRKDCFSGTISGKVSVSVEGSDTCYFAGPNTSTGSFSLTNAAYCGFTGTGVWKGKDFFVSAGSTLVVSNTAAIPAASNITLSDAPDQAAKSCILLGEGEYAAQSMSVDGELLYRGTWGSSQSAARFKDDIHFKGPGVLKLETGAPFPGFRLIIK